MPPPVYPAGSYPARVVADGATAYWRLGETSGTTAVDVIGGKNGTISGGVTLGQAGALADGDKAMAFDGMTGKITIPAIVLDCGPATQSFSMECWIKGPYTGGSDGIFSKGTVPFNAGGAGWELNYFGALTWVFGRTSNGPAVYVTDWTPYPTPNVWSHLVTTYNAVSKVASVFLNGSVVKTLTLSGNDIAAYTDSYPLILGSGSYGSFTGLMDDVALYPTALTPAQIAAHYAARTFAVANLPTVPWAIVGGMVWKDKMDFYNQWVPITPHDTNDIASGPTHGVLIGGTGDVAAVMQNNQVVVLTGMPAGAWLPIFARRINATGTTATGLVALYNRANLPMSKWP